VNAKCSCLERETKQVIGEKKSLRDIKHREATSSAEVPEAQMAGGCENTQRYMRRQASLQS